MNETGATVLLRGRGSGYSDEGQGEDVHQPLHLLISSNNSASLERAKLLAENLLDTICAECGASRVSSCKVYGAVPPPLQPLASVQVSGSESEVNNTPTANVAAQILSSSTAAAVPVTAAAGGTGVVSQGTVPQSLGSLDPVPSQPPTSCYPHQLVTSRTSYIGYDGIYPQATALQQVALALRQSTSPVTSTVPLRFLLAASTGTLFLVALIVLRIYLGWSYVGDRLLSAVIPYEETGWYDGQMWVKPPEILARDRLLGSYKVKPVIKMLKQTLVGTGALLVAAVSLFIFATPVEDFFRNTFTTNENSLSSTSTNSTNKLGIRKEELLRLPLEVKEDDDLAKAAAEAADGRPVYCRDRYYRALAGGQYCKWEDLVK